VKVVIEIEVEQQPPAPPAWVAELAGKLHEIVISYSPTANITIKIIQHGVREGDTR